MRFPPELDLVVACCRWPPSPARDAAVRRAAGEAIDWDYFLKVAARHRVEGLVHDAISGARIVAPAEIKGALSRSASGIARQNLKFAAASIRLREAFDAAGLTFLFVKGVTLNMLAYGSLAFKHGNDIDVVLEPEAHQAACAIVEALGYRCISPGPDGTDAELRAWVARYKHTIWTNAAGVVVELHAGLVDNPLLLAKVSANSPRQSVAIAPGLSLPTLGADALFAYLCVHGASHAWSRLKWLADLAALLKDADPAEIARLHAAAEALGAGRASGQGLLLCARLFELDLGPSLSDRLRRDLPTRSLVRAALVSMVRGGAVVELDSQIFGTLPLHLSHFLLQAGGRYRNSEFKRKLGLAGSGGNLRGLLRSPITLFAWVSRRARERRLHRS